MAPQGSLPESGYRAYLGQIACQSTGALISLPYAGRPSEWTHDAMEQARARGALSVLAIDLGSAINELPMRQFRSSGSGEEKGLGSRVPDEVPIHIEGGQHPCAQTQHDEGRIIGSALILNPRTGAVDSARVPRFPEAFLRSGQFISLTIEGSTLLVEKYGVP